MAEDWQNPDTVKVTTEIEKELYHRVKKAFYHGQMTELMRTFFISIDAMIKDGKIMDIVKYIQKEKSLTISPVKEIEHG